MLNPYKQPNDILGEWIKTEEQLAIAKTYHHKPIGQYDREDLAKMAELMGKWRVLLGATADATEQELIIITQFVYDNFKRQTLADVELAMNWAISGKLDLGFVSTKLMSSFYVSKALNAYLALKKEIYFAIVEEKEKYFRIKEIEETQKRKATPEQKAQIFKEHIASLYESHKKQISWFDFGNFVYEWLKKSGQLNRNQEVIQKAIKYGEECYLAERRSENMKGGLQDALMNFGGNREEKQKKYARKYMVMEYFDRLPLSEILNKINITQF